MVDVGYISIAEFAEKAGVSKQAIYKQVNNENSQLAPYILREGKKTLIQISALSALYGVDTTQTTPINPTATAEQPNSTPTGETEVEETTPQTTPSNPKNNPIQPEPTPKNQPISTDYIAFLKEQIAELKAEKTETERRLSATIQEKDAIIKEQSAQLAQLAQQVARIADKALITTSQQQYLTAMEKGGSEDIPPETPAEEPIVVEQTKEKPKKSFWSRLFHRE